MIRPELAARLHRYRELIAAALFGLAGLWIATRGGIILGPLGLALAALAAAWGLSALRRTRFAREISASGLVEVVEGRVGYFGAGQGLGGYIDLADLTEIRLLQLHGAPHWRLKTRHEAIVIPASAQGAETLYDAFATLPGIDMGRLAAALETSIAAQSLWQRSTADSLD